MIEVLNIPDFRKRVAPISVALYHRMIESGEFGDRSFELIEGSLVEKMSKSELHVFLVRLLFHQLQDCCPETCFVQKEDPVTLDESEPEPDVSVIEGDWRVVKKPTTARFVAEVAITSIAVDRAKAPGYARAEIPEFWIVCPELEQTEVYRKPVNGQYTEKLTIDAKTPIQSTALPGFSFNLAEAIADFEG